MKNLKKVLVIAAAGAICLSNSSLATDALGTTSSFSGKKMLLLAIAVVATILVLYMSYKSDSPSELKPRTKAKKEDKLKDELLEKDNTYEVEEDEVYEDDKISPVSIGKDEDEISLFESVNNPDTEREEEEEEEEEIEEDSSVGFMTRSNVGESKISNREKFKAMSEISNPEETVNDFFSDDEVIKESEEVEEEYNYDAVEENESNTESDSGTMVFNSTELNSKINIFEETEDETENESTEEESDDDEYNYNYDFDFEDKKEEVVEEEEEEVSNETDEDLFEDVEETPTEFVGFTTLKQQTKTRGNSRFERPNYSRDSEAELNKAVKEMEEKVSKEEEENSSNDFLAQMAKNLGGKIEEKETPKKKATVAKKTTVAKSTLGTAKKTSTTTAAKKTTTKKTTKK